MLIKQGNITFYSKFYYLKCYSVYYFFPLVESGSFWSTSLFSVLYTKCIFTRIKINHILVISDIVIKKIRILVNKDIIQSSRILRVYGSRYISHIRYCMIYGPVFHLFLPIYLYCSECRTLYCIHIFFAVVIMA
jgi:hypothetical protein